MAPAPALGGCLKLGLLFLLLTVSTPAATFYVTIAGLGGDAEYETLFTKWATDLDAGLKRNGSQAHVETFTGPASTSQHLGQVFGQLAQEITPDDAVAVFLIGHGSFDGVDYKFNVPGPDISAATLRNWLNSLKASRQLVVNMTSCSGASLPVLAAKNRIVVTATKSGNEKNAPVFARYFIDALHDESADTDKNGVITVLEAVRYAQQKTAAYFTSEKLIASEHSQFSDTGSTTAVRDAAGQQGALASAFPLLHPPSETPLVAASPVKQKLIGHKDEVEARIDRLKYQKSGMDESEYKRQLTALLLDLARTQSEIDK